MFVKICEEPVMLDFRGTQRYIRDLSKDSITNVRYTVLDLSELEVKFLDDSLVVLIRILKY